MVLKSTLNKTLVFSALLDNSQLLVKPVSYVHLEQSLLYLEPSNVLLVHAVIHLLVAHKLAQYVHRVSSPMEDQLVNNAQKIVTQPILVRVSV